MHDLAYSNTGPITGTKVLDLLNVSFVAFIGSVPFQMVPSCLLFSPLIISHRYPWEM